MEVLTSSIAARSAAWRFLLCLLPVCLSAACSGEPVDSGGADAGATGADGGAAGSDGAVIDPALVRGTAEAMASGLAGWSSFLGLAVRDHCVDYLALRRQADALGHLQRTLDGLGRVRPEALPGERERLSYWLNLHNACLVHGLLEGLGQDLSYSVSWGAFSLLREPRCRWAGGVLSLEQIAQGVLRGRPEYGLERLHRQVFPKRADPRIHAALYLGARSSPPLRAAPYPQLELERALERQSRRWVDHPLRGAGPEGMSQIFQWFSEDFTDNTSGWPPGVEGAARFVGQHRSAGLPPVDEQRWLPFDWEPDLADGDDPVCSEPVPAPPDCSPQPEECNGLDDDCDGQTDEELEPPSSACPRAGICVGSSASCEGRDGWRCPLPQGFEQHERSCDGLDNDCDGLTDEDLDPASAGCSTVGLCAEAPPAACDGEAGWQCGQPAGFESPEVSCDGLDNDCNGVVDDIAEPPAGICLHLGVCEGTTPGCVAGRWVCQYPAGYEPETELTCDELDSDCDGVTDEAIAECGCENMERRDCGISDGYCHPGVQYCWQGEWSECSGLEPLPEVCDGVDNDCDGVIDEQVEGCECRPYTYERCGSDQGHCYPGWRRCLPDGTWGPCEGGRQAEPESCDGWDNDCDGEVDEPAELTPPGDKTCSTQGICASYSRLACHGGRWTCLYPEGFERVERSCDGLDNDCDGEVDEDLFLPEISSLPHPAAWDDEECWATGDWAGPEGCCPPRFRVARCTAQGFRVCCLFEICGDPDGRDDDCDGRADEEQCTEQVVGGAAAKPERSPASARQ